MMLTLFVLLGAVGGLFAIVLLCAARESPAPPLPARPLWQELERWLELDEGPTYDARRFDAQIDHMLRTTARWQQEQDRSVA